MTTAYNRPVAKMTNEEMRQSAAVMIKDAKKMALQARTMRKEAAQSRQLARKLVQRSVELSSKPRSGQS